MRPPFAYFGGKMGMAATLVDLLPPHGSYIEPFFGSGAVFFAKPPVLCEIVNDIDGNVVNFFRVLRDRLDELEHVWLTRTQNRRARSRSSRSASRSAAWYSPRAWGVSAQSFGKTASEQTGWSVTTANQSVPGQIMRRIGRFGPVAARLQNASIENCDAVDLIDRLATAATAIFCDPPYLAVTRRGRSLRNTPKDYAHDMGHPEDHVRLAEALHRTPAAVVLCGYPSELYEELYADWTVVDVETLAHSSNALTDVRSERVERIWINRDVAHPRQGVLY